MEYVTLYKVVKEEVMVQSPHSMAFRLDDPMPKRIINSADVVHGLIDVEHVDIEEFATNNTRFLVALHPDTRNLLLKIRDPQKFDSLEKALSNAKSDRNRYHTSLQQEKHQTKVLQAFIDNMESSGLWQRIKWLFSGVKSSDVLLDALKDANDK